MKSVSKILCLSLISSILIAAEEGIVNFNKCISESKKGKQEQATLETLKNQMTSMMEETEKQLTDISQKLNDPEYMDGLSPEAETELKNRFGALSEEMNRSQNQFYQVMQQANSRIMQQLAQEASLSAEKVAKDKKLSKVVTKEAYFYYNKDLDVTDLVIADMDKRFETQQKTQAPTDSSK
jgi:outer membrane protein